MIENLFGKIGYKRSGVGSGDIDYSINPSKIQDLSKNGLEDLKNTLDEFYRVMSDCIYESKYNKPRYRFVDLGFFKYMIKSKDSFNLWPIKFKISKNLLGSKTFFQGHGFETGYENGKRTLGWTIHLGRLKVIIGDKK